MKEKWNQQRYTDFKIIELELDVEPNHPFYGIKSFIWLNPICLPYSYWRIKTILKDYFGWELDRIHPGYKGGRYPGYVNKYRVIDMVTKEVIHPKVTLETLRYVLTDNGFPFEEPKNKRKPACEAFLEAVEQHEKLKSKLNKD